MYAWNRADFPALRPLLQGLERHLAVEALLQGGIPGEIWVDDPRQPGAAAAWIGHHFYLGGTPNDHTVDLLRRFFDETVYPRGAEAKEPAFEISYASAGWEPAVQAFLDGRLPMRAERHHYLRPVKPGDAWGELPPGLEMRRVDAGLLEQAGLEYLDDLKEEMCSERPSVDEFLAKSFGVCLVAEGRELAGWCLSEYNVPGRCEVGIATRGPYQRRGLARQMVFALAAEGRERGLWQLGWHCYANNLGSVATALRAGFEKACAYPVSFAWYQPAANLAVHGNLCLDAGQPAEALDWYRRSFTCDQPPAWAFFFAGRAAARLGDVTAAFGWLEQAVRRGFAWRGAFVENEDLRCLHDRAEWQELLERLV
jgi:GNAT superfamily N-acetyltransferase